MECHVRLIIRLGATILYLKIESILKKKRVFNVLCFSLIIAINEDIFENHSETPNISFQKAKISSDIVS